MIVDGMRDEWKCHDEDILIGLDSALDVWIDAFPFDLFSSRVPSVLKACIFVRT